MRRRLFNLLALGSLLMLGIVVLFWVRSYWTSDMVRWNGERRFIQLFSGYSGFEIYSDTGLLVRSREQPHWCGTLWPFDHARPDDDIYCCMTVLSPISPVVDRTHLKPRASLRFSYDQGKSEYRDDYLAIRTPYWSFALIFTILPLIVLRRWIRKRNRNSFACVSCGYDLRATPDRCPECGAVVSQKPSLAEPRTK